MLGQRPLEAPSGPQGRSREGPSPGGPFLGKLCQPFWRLPACSGLNCRLLGFSSCHRIPRIRRPAKAPGGPSPWAQRHRSPPSPTSSSPCKAHPLWAVTARCVGGGAKYIWLGGGRGAVSLGPIQRPRTGAPPVLSFHPPHLLVLCSRALGRGRWRPRWRADKAVKGARCPLRTTAPAAT